MLIPVFSVRYVLKNKDTDEVLFVVVFTLLQKAEVEKVEAGAGSADEPDKDSKDMGEDKGTSRHEGEKNFEPEADDLD